jgi:integrase/recombinase XerC
MRRALRWLWEYHGAPKLDGVVPPKPAIRPRNVTATRDQIQAIEDAASPALRLLLLMCSDLAIRSGTAVQLGPEHYDRQTRELRFTSKKGSKVNLTATRELAAFLDTCDPSDTRPFITQVRLANNPNAAARQQHPAVDPIILRRELKALRLELGITKRIIFHDLRRTTAVQLYRRTKDLRQVQALLGHRSMQATIWYLDHDLDPVNVADLEAIKQPYLLRPKEKTA